MSDRYAIKVRWDFKKLRYVARARDFPDLIAFGDSIVEATANMEKKIKEKSHDARHR
jgi:predicted RNase H-like HicB family nuclease